MLRSPFSGRFAHCRGDGLSSPSFGSRFTTNSSLKFAPTDLLALLFVMLGKDLAQESDFWQAAHRLGRGALIDAGQQVCYILTDQLAQELTLRFGLGKAGQFKAIDIPVKPFGVQVDLQPVWLLLGDGIERVSHALPHTFQAAEGLHAR